MRNARPRARERLRIRREPWRQAQVQALALDQGSLQECQAQRPASFLAHQAAAAALPSRPCGRRISNPVSSHCARHAPAHWVPLLVVLFIPFPGTMICPPCTLLRVCHQALIPRNAQLSSPMLHMDTHHRACRFRQPRMLLRLQALGQSRCDRLMQMHTSMISMCSARHHCTVLRLHRRRSMSLRR